MFLIWLILSFILSYLIGSLPFGYILGKLAKGVDVRDYGSGKMGATNVLRTMGLGAGLLAFSLDVAKGAMAVYLSGWIMGKAVPQSENADFLFYLARAGGGMAAIIGHNWPVYLSFRGGRGVLTTLGAFLVLSPVSALGATLMGFAVIALWRFVSLGSLIGSLWLVLMTSFFFLSRVLPVEYLILSIISFLLIFFQHRDNLSRLIKGTERKLGKKAEKL